MASAVGGGARGPGGKYGEGGGVAGGGAGKGGAWGESASRNVRSNARIGFAGGSGGEGAAGALPTMTIRCRSSTGEPIALGDAGFAVGTMDLCSRSDPT